MSTNKSALTGKPTTVQALHQNSTIRQVGTPTGAGRQTTVGKLTGTGKQTTAAKQTTVSKPTTVGKPTGTGKGTTVGKLTGAGTPTTLGKPTTIARRPPFNPANTPRTEVTPTVQLQHNSGVQLLNTPISEMSPAVQLQQNSGIQLLNTSTTQVTPAAVQLQHNSAIHLLNPAAQYSINKVTIPGRETVQSLHTSKLNKFSQVAVSGTGGSGQPGGGLGQPAGGLGQPGGGSGQPGGGLGQPGGGLGQPGGGSGQPGGGSGQPGGGSGQPGNAANGPQTEVAPAGSQPLPPPTVMSTSYPATAANKPITKIAPTEQFQQNKRIQGSDQWVDSDYDVFRNYRSEWHDRDWWRTHQSRIVFGVGGWYYWNAGYWFPAWGYDPAVEYAYDGPIYSYNDLPPDQMIANAQRMLQQQGYYQGEPDGLLAAPTSAALAEYQRDHGLYETSTIDQPTSQSLGMK